MIFWNVVTNKSQSFFVHTFFVPEELGCPLFLKQFLQGSMPLALGVSEV